MKIKKLIFIILILSFNTFVFADNEINATDENTEVIENMDVYENGIVVPEIVAESAVLINQDTGKVLYSKNPDKRMYPASLTKVLTLLIATEYIQPDELVVVGNEINYIPWDSSKAGHVSGEVLTGMNIFRGLVLPSGNETANVVALYVAKKETGNESISYEDAEKIFATIMNEKAKELGAKNSNFVTPHGHHDDEHYTTASDMMLIVREAMKNNIIREVVSETEYIGNGAGSFATDEMHTQEYNWQTHNKLLLSADYYYPYATGIKTGYTSLAGSCLAASATKDDENLLAVVLNSPDPDRWIDSKNLFDFGFDNYGFYEIQKDGVIVSESLIDNPPLGEDEILEVVTKGSKSLYLNETEIEKILKKVEIDEEVISKNLSELDEKQLKTPIKNGQKLGEINYYIDDKVIFTDSVISTRDVVKRNIGTDLSYYFDLIKNYVLSWKMIPTTAIVIALVVLLLRRRNKRIKNKYNMKLI
ncbi:MAG: D-alanyl-D-alanine carboxypeptidase family protein [Lachnospirales bacterium]